MRIDPQELASRELLAGKLKNVSAADNFSNLLEIPVLFYVLCILIFVTSQISIFFLSAAWAFVALRVLHSIVHITYNRVTHRWVLYMLSTILLFAMWAVFSISVFNDQGLNVSPFIPQAS